MKRDIYQFTLGEYDLLVIGGGINGAAIANAATYHGLKVALVDKGDFASGTSSKSTKLIHGGLRYLEQGELGLVRDSLRERAILLQEAAYLVKPLGFIIPIYRSDRRPFWMMKLGLTLYDWLSGKQGIHKHEILTVDDMKRHIPGIKGKGLLGGILYYDAQMDDARLCLANVMQAASVGAHVANYAEVKGFLKENGKTVGVRVYDSLTSQYVNIRARKIVCAGGPWTNHLLHLENRNLPPKIRLSKGVHLVLRGQVATHALFIQIPEDKRMFFIIPWQGNSLVGTTDTDYTGNPDDVGVEPEDIDYLLKAATRCFPDKSFQSKDVITNFAGLRPLLRHEGASINVSRRYEITRSYSGILYVVGGKYTTYRKVAQHCMEKILNKKLQDDQEHYPVFGSGTMEEDVQQIAQLYLVSQELVQYLQSFYGTRFQEVLHLTRYDPALKGPICPCSPIIGAQVRYALQYEMAHTVEDIKRRLALWSVDCASQQCQQMIEAMLIKGA